MPEITTYDDFFRQFATYNSGYETGTTSTPPIGSQNLPEADEDLNSEDSTVADNQT
jgi:hypothetical protein